MTTITLTVQAGALEEGLAAEEALRRATEALRAGEVGERVAAFYLADIADRDGYAELGYGDMRELVVKRFPRYAEKTIRNMISVGRALRGLGEVERAFNEGRISWTHVRRLVTIATPETQTAWVVWAEERTTDQLDAQASAREKGDLPTSPERRRLHVPKLLRGARLNPTKLRIWEQAREKRQAEVGRPLSDEDLMMEVAQMILRTRADGGLLGRTQVNDRHYLVHAYPRDIGSEELVTVDENGQEVPIERAELDTVLEPAARGREPAARAADEAGPLDARPATPDPETVDPETVDPETVDPESVDPENHGAVVPVDARDVETPEAVRKEVLARDGYRCRCCGSKENLTVHHRRWRSYGGRTTRSNLVSLCERCHSLVHARLLIVLGDPEGVLRFVDAKGRPLDRAPPRLPVQLTVVPAPGAVATAGGSETTPATSRAHVVDLDRLPAEVDPAWWRRHAPLLSWSERQGELTLTPGLPVEEASPAPERATGPGLGDLVGLAGPRERLRVALAAARARNEPLRHHLLAGPPGVGKTALARAVAADLAAPLVQVPAPHLRTPDALVRTLASLPPGAVLFLDEVHALPARAAEVLYEALDAGCLSLAVRQGARVRTVRLRLGAFTLICATTDPEQLPRALLGRLRVVRLEPYAVDDLATIVGAAARGRGLELDDDATRRLARASRETPRRALALLDAVCDEVTAAGAAVATLELVDRALAREGVDADGLDAVDRGYLRELERARGPVGLGSLAARLDIGADALRRVHEPFLLRRGLIRVTPLGRVRVAAAPVCTARDATSCRG